jgi:FtsH-binding integral membrane protein
VAERAVGFRDVLLLAGACVVVVLGAAMLTSLLPADAQSVVFRTPLLIVVLVGGTALALWRIARPRPGPTAGTATTDDTAVEPPDRPTGG